MIYINGTWYNTYADFEYDQQRKKFMGFFWGILLASIGWLIILSTLAQCARAETIDLNKIALIESGYDHMAYNKSSGATGKYQITPICLKDYNQYHKIKYTMTDMYNPVFNKNVASWYINKRIPQLLRHYGHELNLENTLIAYNCGISCIGRS